MKFRTFIVPLAVIAGLVLVVGLGLLGGFGLRTPLYLIERGGSANPAALQFVPKQSPVVASVLARPDRLSQLWEYLAKPKLRPGIKADMAQIERILLANTGLSYERDLQPWLGEEITVAVVSTDLDQDSTNGLSPGYLVALSCRDSALARRTLELFWQNRALSGDALTFEEVAGNRLIYANRQAERPRLSREPGLEQLATVLVANRFVLAANHPEVLRQALRAAQATEANLLSDQRYRLALRTLPPERVGLLAANLSKAASWLTGEGAEGTTPLTLETLGTPDNQVDWGLVSVGLNRQGIVAEVALTASPGHRLQPRQHHLTDWYGLAQYLPDPLTFAALGIDLTLLAQALHPISQLWEGNPLWPTLERPFDSLLETDQTNLMLTGVDQGYGLGVVLQARTPTLTWLLLSPVSEQLTQTLKTLNDQVQGQGLGVGQVDLFGHPTTVWTRLSLIPAVPRTGGTEPLQIKADVVSLQTRVDRYQVLTSSPATMEQVLLTNQRPVGPPEWTQHLDRLRQPAEAYVHLDWPQLQRVLEERGAPFRLWQAAARPVLKHLQQITAASYGQTDQVQTMGLFFQLSNQPL
ncbi:MAG: DUF3352 domain-containing protein [Leptolyngbyaceae cyanobacterium SM2_5_2]|nr:DUF3352 domain-containing protein [Leptolyngbyaceae cyanobacterium SM2_5_2]